MKLVRFELLDAPGTARSGLVYEERVYETDGEKAIGVHELGRVKLFAPIVPMAGLRLFSYGSDRETLTYRHAHAHHLVGPLGEIEMPVDVEGLDFDARIVAVLQDGGSQVDPHEAKSFVLGYTLALSFRVPSVVEADRQVGGDGSPGMDVGNAIGPFLVTPEDLTESTDPTNPTVMLFPYAVKVNGETVAEGTLRVEPGIDVLLPAATRYSRVFPSEGLAWPPVDKPELEFSSLGRLLLPSDRVAFEVEGIGTLVAKIT